MIVWPKETRTRRIARLGVMLICLSVGGSLAMATSVAAPPHSPASLVQTVLPRPNIVFILTDDLSTNLIRFMPHVRAMERDGLTFRNYFVSDSLCCPSRASIFTGDFPHDTGVLANAGPQGGIGAFDRHGDERLSFVMALHQAGYLTAMVGKYLNRYLETDSGLAASGL